MDKRDKERDRGCKEVGKERGESALRIDWVGITPLFPPTFG